MRRTSVNTGAITQLSAKPLSESPQGNVPHKHKSRRHRHRLLRALCIAAGMVLLFAFAGPILYDTPLYPLSEISAELVGAAYDSTRGIIGAAADAIGSFATRNDTSYDVPHAPRESNFELTLLVNRWNPLPDGLCPALVDIGDGRQVDARCRDDLMQMLADCESDGQSPVICSAYRSHSYQVGLFDNKVSRLRVQGLSDEDARDEAMTVVALPGTSEHQTGLALDIVDAGYQELDEAQEDTAVQKWLMANSWRYGFILRYPTGKSRVTGIIYEPWHYRYVGREAAREMYDSGMCLEEYLDT